MGLDIVRLPFITLPHPAVSGEGVLDPLGLATAGDALANWLIPGMTARMSRPRFLTAMAVSAAVCEGLEDRLAKDGVTPAYVVFEWLLVEAFARAATVDDVLRTPGIEKARTARQRQIPMSAAAYLKTPSVFGFHGVYRRLGVATDIVDEDVHLGENGYHLLKAWEREQGLDGFAENKASNGLRGSLRAAVEDGLANGYVNRSGAWQGWQFFVNHLTLARIGNSEAEILRRIMVDERGETRGELFNLLGMYRGKKKEEANQDELTIAHALLEDASRDLAARLKAVFAFERVAIAVEIAFDLLRYLSTQNPTKALSQNVYAADPVATKIAGQCRGFLERTARAMDTAPQKVMREFSVIESAFESVKTAHDLYAAVLERHAQVQKEKPPEGKREWFEHAADGVMVRTQFRVTERPELHDGWNRPYRLHALRSFCADLGRSR